MTTYTAKAAPGSSAHVKDVRNFETLKDGIDFFVMRGWKMAETDGYSAKMELWIDHSDDPMLAGIDSDVPDSIVFIGPATADFLWPF